MSSIPPLAARTDLEVEGGAATWKMKVGGDQVGWVDPPGSARPGLGPNWLNHLWVAAMWASRCLAHELALS